jgi:hypothetical protein
VIGGNQLRFQRVASMLRFADVMLHWELAHMGRNWTPSIVPNGHDQNFYIVVNNFGKLGPAFAETDVGEADLETTITDLMSGQYSAPVRVVAFNTAERWSEDVSPGKFCAASDRGVLCSVEWTRHGSTIEVPIKSSETKA